MGGWRTRSDDDLSAIMVVVLIICDSNKNASALKRWRGDLMLLCVWRWAGWGTCLREESQ